MKIQKNDKIIICFYIFLAISITFAILHIHSTFGTIEMPNLIPKLVTELKITKEIDVNKETIFAIMTDVENYPKILPRNIISVDVLNQLDNEILVEYEVMEQGIRSKITVQHTFYPYDKHIMEIFDGDAKETKIIQNFTENNSLTIIDTKVELNLKGILTPFAYLPEGNLQHAFDTIITSFIVYSQSYQNETKKIVDDLYREILLRPADQEALKYWGSLLDSGEKTKDEIRTELVNSEEKKNLLGWHEFKTVNELDDKTKKIVDDLYHEILLRPADQMGFEYWGSLLEAGNVSELELRKRIVKSDEALKILFGNDTKSVIKNMIHNIHKINGPDAVDGEFFYDPRLDREKLEKFATESKYRIETEEITFYELENEIVQMKENKINFFVDDLESVNPEFLNWQNRYESNLTEYRVCDECWLEEEDVVPSCCSGRVCDKCWLEAFEKSVELCSDPGMRSNEGC